GAGLGAAAGTTVVFAGALAVGGVAAVLPWPCSGITGCDGEAPEPITGPAGCALGAAASVPTSVGRREAIFTVASWLPGAGVVAVAAVVAGAGAGATVPAFAGAPGLRLMVRVCRLPSCAGGIARLTDWSLAVAGGGLLEKNIGTKMTSRAIRTAAPSRRVFKSSLRGGQRGPRSGDYTCPAPRAARGSAAAFSDHRR